MLLGCQVQACRRCQRRRRRGGGRVVLHNFCHWHMPPSIRAFLEVCGPSECTLPQNVSGPVESDRDVELSASDLQLSPLSALPVSGGALAAGLGKQCVLRFESSQVGQHARMESRDGARHRHAHARTHTQTHTHTQPTRASSISGSSLGPCREMSARTLS